MKDWGHWSSSAYLLYSRLKLDRKKAIFAKVIQALGLPARTEAGFPSITDPGASAGPTLTARITAEDAAILKKKFPFLKEYSNEYLQSTQLDVLIRA